jgi:hypothetical protein
MAVTYQQTYSNVATGLLGSILKDKPNATKEERLKIATDLGHWIIGDGRKHVDPSHPDFKHHKLK